MARRTIARLDSSGRAFARIELVFHNLCASEASPALQAAPSTATTEQSAATFIDLRMRSPPRTVCRRSDAWLILGERRTTGASSFLTERLVKKGARCYRCPAMARTLTVIAALAAGHDIGIGEQ